MELVECEELAAASAALAIQCLNNSALGAPISCAGESLLRERVRHSNLCLIIRVSDKREPDT